MLIFPLKKEWYEKIKSGEKTVEYREVKDYWTKRLYKWCKQQWESINVFDGIIMKFRLSLDEFASEPLESEFRIGNKSEKVYFQCGYNSETRLSATILKIKIMNGKNTDLKIDKPVYAIYFRLEK